MITLHPAASDEGEEVRVELRKLIERVHFIPLEYLGKFELEVRGGLRTHPVRTAESQPG